MTIITMLQGITSHSFIATCLKKDIQQEWKYMQQENMFNDL